ncbi:hypothetical protein Ddc_03879 [Ditylenchus destructor]|nr:hypothetical protein Ddc_03879 [Ditylenchus destructor]
MRKDGLEGVFQPGLGLGAVDSAEGRTIVSSSFVGAIAALGVPFAKSLRTSFPYESAEIQDEQLITWLVGSTSSQTGRPSTYSFSPLKEMNGQVRKRGVTGGSLRTLGSTQPEHVGCLKAARGFEWENANA